MAGEAGDEKGRLTFIGSANALPSYKKFSKWKIQCVVNVDFKNTTLDLILQFIGDSSCPFKHVSH